MNPGKFSLRTYLIISMVILAVVPVMILGILTTGNIRVLLGGGKDVLVDGNIYEISALYWEQVFITLGSLALAGILIFIIARIFALRMRQVEQLVATERKTGDIKVAGEFQGIVDLVNRVVNQTLTEKNYFTNMLNNLPVGILATDNAGRFCFVNAKVKDMLGYECEELLGLTYKNLYSMCQPEPVNSKSSPFATWKEGKPVLGHKMKVYRKDRSRASLEVHVYPMHKPNGELAGDLALFSDLSLELKYRNLQSWGESVLDCVHSGVIAIDNEYKVTVFNPAAERILEIDSTTVLGREIFTVLPPLNDGRRVIVETLSGGQPISNLRTSTVINNQKKEILINTALVRDELGEVAGAVTVFSDITELHRYEERIKEQDKLSVVGQMAAGMAHELRNPLTSVRGFIQLLHQRLGEDEKSRGYFDVILQEIDRTNEILNDFLILAKPKPPKLSLTPLHNLLEEILPLCESQCLMSNIRIERNFADYLQPVVIDKDQMKQVILNLVQNSIEAMEGMDAGVLALRTRYDKQACMVVLEISDTGKGIGPEDLAKLGTPFFTTKDRGTGLGLSVSYRIMEAHRGRIAVESQTGKGTNFALMFPAGYL